MAAQLSPHPIMLNMDVQLATRKEPRTFFCRKAFYSAGKPGPGQLHLSFGFYSNQILGSQSVSSERTNWGMHDNPLLTSLIPKLILSFCFLLVLFPRNMHALSYNNIGTHASTGSSTNTSTGTRYKQPWQ